MTTPVFLTLVEVVQIHKNQIELYGGAPYIRDMSLLQSALAQPEASFAGTWLHADLFEMAAAYAFHTGCNHPFIDGNKRTALASALVFLGMNGIDLTDPRARLLEGMLKLVEGKLSKKKFARLLQELVE
ncbi:MAG: type II toxin-antitoxin system death-on-curing family toxin [Candidatus Omnitrophica bacterium]|nr:type II toxin-antitoxin system death-on-curing family toxin [Candidatus Omnitrophota bacterium]